MIGGTLGARQELALIGLNQAVQGQSRVLGAIVESVAQTTTLAASAQALPAPTGGRGQIVDISV